MLPLVDKPALQYIVEEAAASGIKSVLIVTGRGKRALEDHFDHAPELEAFLREKGQPELAEVVRRITELVSIHYVRQKEPKGLGHAVLCARDFVGAEFFAVMLGDDVIAADPPALRQLATIHGKTGGSALAVMEVPPREVNRYGIVAGEKVGEGLWRVRDLVEKPDPEEAPSTLAVIGRYILSPRIFEILSETRPGKGGEIQLTDALRTLCREEPLYAYAFRGERFDVGEKLGYMRATVELALRHPEIGEEFKRYLRSLCERLWG
jgi:UTP--glucose-1-phosphate uridylyltransferase